MKEKVKKILYFTLVVFTLISNGGCSPSYKIITPTGAAALPFYSSEGHITSNNPSQIITKMYNGEYEIAVVDIKSGLSSIKNNAPYKLGAIITFGNLYIYSPNGKTTIEKDDKVYSFAEGSIINSLVYALYPDINIEHYGQNVAATRVVMCNGELNGVGFDHIVTAEPVLSTINSCPTYPTSKVINLQTAYSNKFDLPSYPQAAIFIKNGFDAKGYLTMLKSDIQALLADPSVLPNRDDFEQFFGINIDIAKSVVSSNSVGIGFELAVDYIEKINKYFENISEPIIVSEDQLYE